MHTHHFTDCKATITVHFTWQCLQVIIQAQLSCQRVSLILIMSASPPISCHREKCEGGSTPPGSTGGRHRRWLCPLAILLRDQERGERCLPRRQCWRPGYSLGRWRIGQKQGSQATCRRRVREDYSSCRSSSANSIIFHHE